MRFDQRRLKVYLVDLIEARDRALDAMGAALKSLEAAGSEAAKGKVPMDREAALRILRHHYRPGSAVSLEPTLQAVRELMEVRGWGHDVATPDRVLKKVAKALALFDDAQGEASKAGFALEWGVAMGLVCQFEAGSPEAALAALKHKMDLRAWANILRDMGLWGAADVMSLAKWQDIIATHSGPLEDGLNATWLRMLHARAVADEDMSLLSFMRMQSWDPEAGLPILLGETLEMRGFIDAERKVSVGQKSLDHLNQWMSFLDGREEQPKPDAIAKLCGEALNQGRSDVETAYLVAKWSKSGKAVVSFKRPDIVARVNDVVRLLYPDAAPVRS